LSVPGYCHTEIDRARSRAAAPVNGWAALSPLCLAAWGGAYVRSITPCSSEPLPVMCRTNTKAPECPAKGTYPNVNMLYNSTL